MPIFDTTVPKSNPLQDRQAQQLKRSIEEKTEERNRRLPVFMFQRFGFRPQYSPRGSLRIVGPLCPNADIKKEPCLTELKGGEGESTVNCEVCGFSAVIPSSKEEFRHQAHLKYEGRMRYLESGGKIETLDVPYEAIKAEGKDDTREIKIKWSQKDGRNAAMIYFFENSTNGEKVHIIADFDREELRHDADNILPGRVLAKITAEFPKTKSEITYKE